jgi:hypothetical protein
MRDDLIAWQWTGYPRNHVDRKNLAIHIVTWPLFLAGTVLAVVDLFFSPWLVLVGLGLMVFAVAMQGRGHKVERQKSVPFEGPVDFVTRFFVEQWVNFPRFVLGGGFARAWRAAGAGPGPA